MLMLSVPATVGLMVLARADRRAASISAAGSTPTSTLVTAQALLFYAPGIVGYSIVKMASPSFYSLQDARTPVIVSVVTIADESRAEHLRSTRSMGFRGLALGTAIAANVNAVLLLVLLSRRIGGIDGARVLAVARQDLDRVGRHGRRGVLRRRWLRAVLPPSLMGYPLRSRLVRVLGAIGAGIGTLALAAWAAAHRGVPASDAAVARPVHA